ncbi:hypothetical protein F5876DRAFT_66060 [Lentinula aff. lateritia]|uniref:Uncharacterized protein n=1 Tax=Lentinula aff. lateritia TaxID=2804960 RepID=A0ACC1TZL4_9AGAR|nr:hypothetical protein F5876DRAFT_66060 [Lentinula aff. lateritia]
MSNTTSPPMAPFPSAGFDLSSIFDAFFYGVIISTGLFGISIVQLWTYINLSRDRWMFRVVVITVFLMDMATTYLDIGLLHNYLVIPSVFISKQNLDFAQLQISHFGDLSIFSSYSNLLDMEILFTALIVFVVDLYFASRVYLPVFTRLGFSSKDNEIIVALENAMTTMCEVVATTALAWSLHSSRTGVPRTDNILHKLHNYTITRGVLLTIVQILSLVFYVAQPTKLTWIAFHMCLSKLYFITMAAMYWGLLEILLNTRSSLRRRLDRTITDSEVGRIIQQSGHDFARGTSFVLASNPDASALNDSNSLAEFGLSQISTPDTENPDDDHESVHSIKVSNGLKYSSQPGKILNMKD